MIFGRQLAKIFSKRANPPKGARVPGQQPTENKYRGAQTPKPRRKTMKEAVKKTVSSIRRKTAKKKKR